MSEIEDRRRKLLLALKGAKKVDWPTVQIPATGFKRLPTGDKAETEAGY